VVERVDAIARRSARLVEAALPTNVDTFSLVGHSFGGSVAMKLAARLSNRVAKLVLLETNPFYLLKQAGRADAFAEATDLRDCIKKFGALGEWVTAAERFADYWGGTGSWASMSPEPTGSWASMSPERRQAFAEALKPNYFEWDAVMNETTSVEQWARLLPDATLTDPRNHGAFAPILSQVDLRGNREWWSHGAAYASRSHQSACAVVSAIAVW